MKENIVNFRLVGADKFPDCCFVCKSAQMEYEWEVCCANKIRGYVGGMDYPKIWTVCDKFERCDKDIFEKQ